jgi:hypothetical protein
VRLHQELGNDPYTHGVPARAKHRIEDDVVIVVFPRRTVERRLDENEWHTEINRVGQDALANWGGSSRLKRCGL